MKHQRIKELFIYGYPIMGMYQLLNEQVVQKENGAFHEFMHTANVSTPETNFVPAPNNDTTYSRCWLDLRNGPVIIETPDTNGRFYTIQLLDIFSETSDNLGKRKYGTKPHKFAIMHVDCKEVVDNDMIVVRCNTFFALAFLRVLIQNEQQLEEVKRIQNEFHVYPLNKQTIEPIPIYNITTKKEYVHTLIAILNASCTKDFDSTIRLELEQLKQVDEAELETHFQDMIQEVDEKGKEFGEHINGWRIARKKIGVYGDDYLQRSVVWHKGALANVPEESLYPSAFLDIDNELLDGSKHSYYLHFKKEELPPVSQFWSLTMYIYRNAFLSENEIHRYSIGDRSEHLVYGEDGSLTIYIQHHKPKAHETNWLPCPNEPFYMTLRLYGPSPEAIQGTWNPPAIRK